MLQKIKPTGADVVSLICLDFHKPSINQRRCITLALFKQYYNPCAYSMLSASTAVFYHHFTRHAEFNFIFVITYWEQEMKIKF